MATFLIDHNLWRVSLIFQFPFSMSVLHTEENEAEKEDKGIESRDLPVFPLSM